MAIPLLQLLSYGSCMKSRRKKWAIAFLPVLIYPGVKLGKQLSLLLNRSLITLLNRVLSWRHQRRLLTTAFLAALGIRGRDVLCARWHWHARLDFSVNGVSHQPRQWGSLDTCCAPWLCFLNILCAVALRHFLCLMDSTWQIPFQFPLIRPHLFVFSFPGEICHLSTLTFSLLDEHWGIASIACHRRSAQLSYAASTCLSSPKRGLTCLQWLYREYTRLIFPASVIPKLYSGCE